MPCDEFGRVFASLWLEQQDKEGSRHHIMTHVEVIKNSTTNRTTTFVMAAYDLGGMMICPCRLNIQSVKAVPTPTAATVTTAGGTLLGSTDGDLTMTEVMTPPPATEPTLEALMNTDTSSEEPTVAVLRETQPLTTENNNNIIANNDTPLPEVAAMVHDQEWFVDDPAMKLPVNGNYHFRNWAIKTRMGYMLGQGGDHQNSYSCLEYFFMLFPPEQLQLILQLTNNELAMARKNYTMAGEIVKFFGVMLLVTWFEFGSRASLWINMSTNKYIPAPLFGLTGMPWKQFDDLWMCIRFSDQPHNRPSEMTSEQYRWRLVDDFIKNFNKHQGQNFFHWMRFVSMSPCPGGMGKATIGSTMACQCMLQSTGNQKMAVRSRMLPVGILE